MSILRKIYYSSWGHLIFFPFVQMGRVIVCRRRYKTVLRRIRHKVANGRKIRVVFLADDPCKWKYQGIYQLMSKHSMFDPIVALDIRKNEEYDLPYEELMAKVDRLFRFYRGNGCECMLAFNPNDKSLLGADELGADIFFYQEPWMLHGKHTVMQVSKHALSCYVPYSVEWEFDRKLHWHYDFHRLLFADFAWNAQQSVEESPKGCFALAGMVYGVGHPALDFYLESDKVCSTGSEYVIYAPHFTFHWKGEGDSIVLGTFEWNGREILEFAKQHPEVRWAFKPHPGLRWNLEAHGFMTHAEVDRYYRDWESIGIACYDGNYQDLFRGSNALITDCGSFLMEYVITGKPIIRPLAERFSLVPSTSAKKLFDTYYEVHAWDELREVLDEVVVRGEDPLREKRLGAIRDAGLCGEPASEKVLGILTCICKGVEPQKRCHSCK